MTTIYTIGHSTRTAEEFSSCLRTHGITMLADVRTYPGSRRYPQFGKETLRRSLMPWRIGYVHLEDLGGRRGKQDIPTEINNAWRNASFKNYADYTLTEDYERGLQELLNLAEEEQVAYMCSEAVPWRCHRLLVSNTLRARGCQVVHIKSADERGRQEHELGLYGPTPTVNNGIVTYPKNQS